MTIVGGLPESKEIGLSISLTGIFENTEIDNETGYLKLKTTDIDANGNPVHAEEAYWISDTINLGDKFADFDKVFTTEILNGNSSLSVQTRVSDNGYDWSEWTPVAMDGTIQSDTKQYIQVKIILYAGFVTDSFVITNSDFENNKFVQLGDDIRLKHEYEFDMTLDSTWAEKGSLHRKLVTRDEWLRIDKMNVLSEE